jgi:hypothetical protein
MVIIMQKRLLQRSDEYYYVTALGSASIERCLTATEMDRCFDGDYYVEEAASAQRRILLCYSSGQRFD